MLNIELNSEAHEKLKKLAAAYKNDYDTLFEDFFNFNVEELKRGMKNIEIDFAFFENKYSISTNEFYQNFKQGKFDDTNDDFLRWSGEYEIWLEHKQELEKLQ